MSGLLVVAVALPGVAAGAAALGRSANATGRIVATATGVAFACAGVLTVLLASGTPAAATLLARGDEVLVGLRADRITAVLLLVTLGISWIVQSFALRSLFGDARARRFAILAGAVTSFAAATAAAATLLGLAVAWSLTTLALCGLIALYRGYEQAEEGVRRTGLALAIGDGALWLAVALLTLQLGSVDLAALREAPPELDAATTLTAGLLIVVAAAARSVQVPFHGWLPATLASPTPVSALLHAGVVNAGAVLLLLLAPLLTQSPIVMHATVALGALTAAVGIPLMLARPDVKGALAQSTVAQMGFMIMTCGLGLWAAAVLHLAAHGAYKAARFLGSGSAVAQVAAHRAAHGAPQASAANTVMVGVLAALPLIATAVVMSASGGAALLLVFAWLALTLAGRGWVAHRPGPGGLIGFAIVSALLGAAYVAAVETFAHFVEPAAPEAAGALPSPWLLVPAALLMLVGPAVRAAGPRRLQHRLYVWALTAGDGSRPPRRRRGTPLHPLVVDVDRSSL